MKSHHRSVTLHNIIFPVWMIVWLPTWLWLFVIPANYLVDRLVFTLSAKKDHPERTAAFFRAHTWKLWLAGFAADFAGAALLLGAAMLPDWLGYVTGAGTRTGILGWVSRHISNPVMFNPFTDAAGLLFTLVCIAVSGLLIYAFDKAILNKTGAFTPAEARRIARNMAVFTAPYLYLIPVTWFRTFY